MFKERYKYLIKYNKNVLTITETFMCVASSSKDFCLTCWWRCSICYSSTSPHRSANFDCNVCIWIHPPSHFFSIKDASPLKTSSHHSKFIERTSILQTSLKQRWDWPCPLAGGHFPVQRDLRNLSIRHTVFVSKPASYCRRTYSLGNRVGPIDAQHASQTAKMKGAEASLLSGVETSSVAAVDQDADDTCRIDCNVKQYCI